MTMTYCGDYFMMYYTNAESLYCTSETNTVYVCELFFDKKISCLCRLSLDDEIEGDLFFQYTFYSFQTHHNDCLFIL